MGDTTYQQQLLQGLQAALAVLGTALHTERMAPFAGDECPAVNLLLDGTRFEVHGAESHTGFSTLVATVDVLLRVHTRAAPHTTVAAPTVALVHRALMADPSLGGCAISLTLRSAKPTAAAVDGGVGTLELLYQATALVDERTLTLIDT